MTKKECPYCKGFQCDDCLFCTKYDFDGERIVKRRKVLKIDDVRRFEIKSKSWNDSTGTTVPFDYSPMSSKEDDIAAAYDYEFENDPYDNRSVDELCHDLVSALQGYSPSMADDFLRRR